VPTITARLLSSLEAIRAETVSMRDAIDGTRTADEDRALLLRAITSVEYTTDQLMDWLSEQRLESPKN
jgi:hypothetical protein